MHSRDTAGSPAVALIGLRGNGRPRRLALLAAVGLAAACAGCDNANVSYGVGFHTGSYGWGSSFSVGISNHHYRNYPGYRRGP